MAGNLYANFPFGFHVLCFVYVCSFFHVLLFLLLLFFLKNEKKKTLQHTLFFILYCIRNGWAYIHTHTHTGTFLPRCAALLFISIIFFYYLCGCFCNHFILSVFFLGYNFDMILLFSFYYFFGVRAFLLALNSHFLCMFMCVLRETFRYFTI